MICINFNFIFVNILYYLNKFTNKFTSWVDTPFEKIVISNVTIKTINVFNNFNNENKDYINYEIENTTKQL